MKEEPIINRMRRLYPFTHGPEPRCYLAQSTWLRLHSRMSKIPAEILSQAANLRALYADMKRRPDRYRMKPTGRTDWEHYMEGTR